MRSHFRFTLFAGIAVTFLLSADVPAQQTRPSLPSLPATAGSANDLYSVPEGDDLAVLDAAFLRLLTYRPKTPAELSSHKAKFPAALKGICQRVVALDTDPKSVRHKSARHMLITLRLDELLVDGASDTDRKVFLDKFAPYLASLPLGQPNADLAGRFASGLEAANSRNLAVDAYLQLGAVFAKATDAEVAQSGRKLLGAAKRLSLEGQPFALKGKSLAGDPFDLETLRGKVVLVDFWATWCPPCKIEHANIRKNYDAFHARGFEVVGISTDKDQSALAKYLAAEPAPWVMMHEKDVEGDDAAGIQYGIYAIPRSILIDADGKVVSIYAWGQNLSKLLASKLGAPGN